MSIKDKIFVIFKYRTIISDIFRGEENMHTVYQMKILIIIITYITREYFACLNFFIYFTTLLNY